MKNYKKDLPFSYSIGVYPTLELLQTQPKQVTKILLHSHGARNNGVQKIKALAAEHHIPVKVSDHEIYSIAHTENTYAMAAFQKFDRPIVNDNHILLVNPGDAGNLGTIMRTMIAFGVYNLAIITPAVDHYDPKTIRASMGSIFRINISVFKDLESYLKEYKTHKLYPFITSAKASVVKAKFEEPFTLIFGNEGAGLGIEYKKLGTPLSIPISEEVDSLNLSIAVGIALHHTTLKK
jgi:RNA methyltransferase, TrmH family